MSEDRDRLIQIMRSLDADYRAGKISKGKYAYFRSKYEDKLNSIEAVEATKRIRSMQGKSSAPRKNRKSKKPTNDKRKHEQDLVQKYIINPKKDDAKYKKKKKSSMDGSTFKLMLVLVLVVGFTVGIAYGFFNLDTETVSETTAVAIVEDTAFPEISVNLTNIADTTFKNTTKVVNTTASDDDTSDDTDDDTSTDDSSSKKSSQDSSTRKRSSDDSSSRRQSSDDSSRRQSSGGNGTG